MFCYWFAGKHTSVLTASSLLIKKSVTNTQLTPMVLVGDAASMHATAEDILAE